VLVTIIVPVYNGAGFIPDTLESVSRQSHPEWECVVVDDGSTDDTAAIVKKITGGDDRFSYVYQRNAGLSAARNAGLERARGEYIQFLDADDIILPTKIGEQLEYMVAKKAAVSYTDYLTGCATDVYTPAEFYKPAQFHSAELLLELIARWESGLIIPPHCWLFSASFFRENKLRFDTTLANHEDFDCWVNIFRLRPAVAYLDKKLAIYRVSEGSMSRNMIRMGEGFLQVLDNQRNKPGQPTSLRKVIDRKKRETMRRYNRFDRMTLLDKLLSFRYLIQYYFFRILKRSD
jgi:glycosyltransferase involved in cell wall biosynthesis